MASMTCLMTFPDWQTQKRCCDEMRKHFISQHLLSYLKHSSAHHCVFVGLGCCLHYFFITGQGGKGGELGGAFVHGHTYVSLWFGAWQVDYALVVLDISIYYHALCPPISLFLIIVRASSLRLAALLSADTIKESTSDDMPSDTT